ncbi:FKBP-like protein [Schizopora paradoxa]|uniref:FK506-binding protein n=1 Tax=Schizopora paradoxa TaxID=27342 RepID=A0A0H2S912_9AGAM|nr:FKBP-like protein [Schizopora paradoxa]
MATTALQVWSLSLPAGKQVKVNSIQDIRITNAALGEAIADENSRSVVKLTYLDMAPSALEEEDEDEIRAEQLSTVLCALTPGKIEQASLDIIITEEDDFIFENLGKNLIHLSGNYIYTDILSKAQADDEDPSDTDDSDDDEEGYPLQDVSSDVEVDPEELDMLVDDDDDEADNSHRFEEVKEEDSKSKKRAREEDAADDAEEEGQKKLSKKEKKALKKQKAEDGKAVPTAEVNGDEKPSKEKKEKKEKKADKSDDLKEMDNGLQYKDVKVGSGKVAKKGDLVSMRYIGKFPDGKTFDKNIKGKPFTFKLGAGEVIKGWDEGIAGMQPGGERLLVVPPKLGYGNRKIDGIPAGSTLRFECKLIEIK